MRYLKQLKKHKRLSVESNLQDFPSFLQNFRLYWISFRKKTIFPSKSRRQLIWWKQFFFQPQYFCDDSRSLKDWAIKVSNSNRISWISKMMKRVRKKKFQIFFFVSFSGKLSNPANLSDKFAKKINKWVLKTRQSRTK